LRFSLPIDENPGRLIQLTDRSEVAASKILRIALSGVEARRAIEEEGLARLLPAWSIRGALASAASLEPEKPAIRFVRDAGAIDQVDTISYRALIGSVETAASLFRAVSDGPSVVSVLAPLLPEAVIAQ
jgi:fatty-acyl-CoA synthase